MHGRWGPNTRGRSFGVMRDPSGDFGGVRGVEASDFSVPLPENESGNAIDAVNVYRHGDFVYIAVREGDFGISGGSQKGVCVNAAAGATPLGTVPDESGGGGCGGRFELGTGSNFVHEGLTGLPESPRRV